MKKTTGEKFYLKKLGPVKTMTDHTQKQCPKCGQQLRFPKNIGGMLMACPSCGNKFISDFKIGGIKTNVNQGVVTTVFEMPYKILRRISRFLAS